jgi:hypothetical protein
MKYLKKDATYYNMKISNNDSITQDEPPVTVNVVS